MDEGSEPIIKEPFRLSRRTAIAGGITLFAVSLYYYGYLDSLIAWLCREEGDYGFLQRSYDPLSKKIRKVRDPSYVFKHLKPVGPKVDKIDFSEEFDDKTIDLISQSMGEEAKKKGWEDINLSISRQAYAVPDYRWYRNQLVQYCIKADNFLRNHPQLQSLSFPKIVWESVLPGKDYSNAYQGKGLIGHSAFNIYKIKVENSENRKESFTLPYSLCGYSQGSTTFHYSNDWFIYISASDPYCLVVPFATQVLIALTSMEQREELVNKFSLSETKAIETALWMAISHTLASELSDKLTIPRGKEIVEESLEQLLKNPRYRLLKSAIEFIDKYGIKEGIRLYQQNPIEFREQLLRY